MKVFVTVWLATVFWAFALVLMFHSGSASAAKVVLSDHVGGEYMRTMGIIEFNGHTYIHYRSGWHSADSAFFHDPDCQCIKNAVQKILDGLKEKKND